MSDPSPQFAFSDGKAPDALRTIGEVSAGLGIRQHVLRYWEDQFPTLRPIKRSGGRRYYRPEDIALIVTIDRLVHREGYTLRGARLAIEGGSAKSVQDFASPAQSPADANAMAPQGTNIVPQLRAIRESLAAALAES